MLLHAFAINSAKYKQKLIKFIRGWELLKGALIKNYSTHKIRQGWGDFLK